jgi:hypothetical protein
MDEAAAMRPLAYLLQFRGFVRELSERVLELRASAPGQRVVTIVGDDGIAGRFEPGEGDEAILVTRRVIAADGSFDERGTISFGRNSSIRFRTIGSGRLAPSPDPHLCHGTVVWEVEDGEGQFDGARGRITSNFFVSDTGELTDNQLGVIFVADRAPIEGEQRRKR